MSPEDRYSLTRLIPMIQQSGIQFPLVEQDLIDGLKYHAGRALVIPLPAAEELIMGTIPEPMHCICGADMTKEIIEGLPEDAPYRTRYYCPNKNCEQYLTRYLFRIQDTGE